MRRLFVQLISDVDCKQKVRQVVLQEKGFIQEQQGIMIGVHATWRATKTKKRKLFYRGEKEAGKGCYKEFPQLCLQSLWGMRAPSSGLLTSL